MLNAKDLLLYLCTDRVLSLGRPILQAIEESVMGGATMIQLREKDASTREFYEIALEVRALTKRLGIPMVVNDRIDIALAAEADGLHIGQSDMPLPVARKLVGSDMFIGVSAGTVEKALLAERDGADYLGVGAVFPTNSKAGVGKGIGLDSLREIRSAVKIPVVAIGGINAGNAAQVMETGVEGVAVISAILSGSDIQGAARVLRDSLK